MAQGLRRFCEDASLFQVRLMALPGLQEARGARLLDAHARRIRAARPDWLRVDGPDS